MCAQIEGGHMIGGQVEIEQMIGGQMEDGRRRSLTLLAPFLPDPYVKVCLMCQGRRIKKRKTSVQRNTLNPVFNEALVFDVPQESVEDVYLVVKLVDYDRIGSDELMGCVALGPKINGQGREHWYEMLESPRKPVAQWYALMEHVTLPSSSNGKCCLRQRQSTEESNHSDGNL
ncbi:Synaptotagmin-9 [Bulinus truncatus]|nr:Synaptotagmin-9 [Bulinus truncatus]